MFILVVEDDLQRQSWFKEKLAGHSYLIVDTAELGIDALRGGVRFDLVFLDHDLAATDDEKRGDMYSTTSWGPDGHGVAKAIAAMTLATRPKAVHIHSWNIDGAIRMERTLKDVGVKVTRAEFGRFTLDGILLPTRSNTPEPTGAPVV